MGGYREGQRPQPRGSRTGCSGLRQVERHHRDLRHGRDPAQRRHRQCPPVVRPADAARQLRQAWRRHLPLARPLQRAGEPYRRHHREAVGGLPAAARGYLRLQAAGGARARRRQCHAGDDRWPVQGAALPGRQLCRGPARSRAVLPGNGPARPERACRDQAQPHAPAGGEGDLRAAVPGPHRARCPAGRSAVGDGGGLDVDGACLGRQAGAGLRVAALRARHRGRHRHRDPAGQQGAMAGTGGGLRPHPRADREDRARLRGFQPACAGAGRLPHAVAGGRAQMGNAVGQGRVLRVRRPARRQAGPWRRRAASGDDPQP
ncbi:hypothetical protein D9M68_587600 [compost metagenome]